MRVFQAGADGFAEVPALPVALPAAGFTWVALSRDELAADRDGLQAALLRWTGGHLVDLHLSDLLNAQLPSRFEATSWYDLLVFRELALAPGVERADPRPVNAGSSPAAEPTARPSGVPLAVDKVETVAVGFAVFDRVLLSVHPAGSPLPEAFAQRLAGRNGGSGGNDLRGGARAPVAPAELMLRMVSHIVDGYLELRRVLTRRLGRLQQDLLDPRRRFAGWQLLLDSRNDLHLLEDICEDQRAAIVEWIEALAEWPEAADPERRREHELLGVRSRDVQEHVERVLVHVGRLERSTEAAVQMHFSALAHRTNSIMRTLTVLTAVFLPLNLVTGFFGMNFDTLPLIHTATGIWVAVAVMLAMGFGLLAWLWRKRYLDSDGRR